MKWFLWRILVRDIQGVRQVTIDITIRGNGQERTFTGRIIGFSERINSVLVPEDFMAFANKNFGDQPDLGASRLLLKVANPYDQNLTHFLEEKGYELLHSDFERVPTDTKELTEEQAADIEKLIERLEDDDDVQNIYHNMVVKE